MRFRPKNNLNNPENPDNPKKELMTRGQAFETSVLGGGEQVSAKE